MKKERLPHRRLINFLCFLEHVILFRKTRLTVYFVPSDNAFFP